MRNTLFWVGVSISLTLALAFSLTTREPRTCQQEYTAGYRQGIVETTTMFEEAAR